MTIRDRARYAERVAGAARNYGMDEASYRVLASINHRLVRWFGRECDGDIARDDETGKVYGYSQDRSQRYRINDTETAGRKQAKAIANRLGGWIYFQTDPRGCAVYFFRYGKNGEPGPYRIGRDEDIRQVYPLQACACYF